MRATFTLGLVAAVASAFEEPHVYNSVTAPEVVELIDGFIVGALGYESVDSLETCVTDVDPLVTDMIAAVKDFEEGSFQSIADGIYQLGQFVSQVGISLEDCASISTEDIAKLEAMGDAFLHPGQLVIDASHNVVVNGFEIYKDIRKAGKDMDDGKYEEAGVEYGIIAALVFFGKNANFIMQ